MLFLYWPWEGSVLAGVALRMIYNVKQGKFLGVA